MRFSKAVALVILLTGLTLLLRPSFAESKMREAIANNHLSMACNAKLVAIADRAIGKRAHRILAQQTTDETFAAFVLLSYTDQDTHLSFRVMENAAYQADACVVDMNESYELPANCLEARDAMFKRWAVLGRLSEKTLVLRYDNPRKKSTLISDENARAKAYLTQTRRGTACLIAKQQYNIPAIVEEK